MEQQHKDELKKLQARVQQLTDALTSTESQLHKAQAEVNRLNEVIRGMERDFEARMLAEKRKVTRSAYMMRLQIEMYFDHSFILCGTTG